MEKGFATINFRTKLTANDWEYLYQVFNDEIVRRLAAYTGGYGIVDDIDPQEINTSDLTRPLVVSINTTIPERVDVNAGVALTEDGNLVWLATKQLQFALSSYAINSIHVVFIEYLLVDSVEKRLNDYTDLAPVRTERASDALTLQSTTLATWNDVTSFSASRKKNCIVLAVTTVVEKSGGGVALEIDLSGSNYVWNRMWFSIKDIEHRNMKGTGSSLTPHSLGLADLSAGDLTLYSQMLKHGYVLARDYNVSGVPGHRCVEAIPSIAIMLDDAAGTRTQGSRYGGPYARYVTLLHYPKLLGSAYESGSPANSLCVDYIPSTNVLVFSQDEVIPANIIVEYFHVYGMEPPVSVTNNEVIFDVPKSWELLISGGRAFNTVTNPVKSFEGYGPIPRIFTMYFDAQGDLIHNPQMVKLATRLDGMGYIPAVIDTTLYDNSKIVIGLTRAVMTPTMEVVLELRGTDLNNALLIETVTFSGTTWIDNVTLPGQFKPEQFITSVNVFKTLSQISVLSRTNDGPNSTIIVYAWQEPYQSPKYDQICEVSEITWDGLGVSTIRDLRRVSERLDMPSNFFAVDAVSEGLADSTFFNFLLGAPPPNGNVDILVSEDFRRPRWMETFTDFVDAKKAHGSIDFTGFNSAITDGDTIALAPFKTITARTGAADHTIGEFKIGLSESATRTEMINAINNTTFNCGVVASQGSGDAVVLLEKAAAGLSGNYLITAVLSNPNIMAFNGFHYGFEAIAPLQLNRFVDGIATPIPPAADETKPRYQSRSFGVTRTWAVFDILDLGANVYRVTTTTPHDLHNGSVVALWGVSPNDFDGEFVIFNVTATTFRITLTSGFLWSVGGLCARKLAVLFVIVHGGDAVPALRYSDVFRPEVWQAPIPVTSSPGPRVFRFDVGTPLSKVQFELYGRAVGMTAYLHRPQP